MESPAINVRIAISLALSGLLLTSLGGVSATAKTPKSACAYRVSEKATALVVTEAGVGSTELRQTAGDQAKAFFTGALGGKAITVTVWRGLSNEETADRVNRMQDEWATLAAESLAGATEGATSEEVVASFSPSSEFGEMETFAVAVDDGSGLVDYRSSASDATITDKTGSSRDGCIRSEAGTAVTIDSDQDGGFVFPVAAAAAANSIIRYRTFIKPAKVDDWLANLTCGIFKGDNRNYTTKYTAPHRTYAALVFNWSAKTLSTAKAVGTTHKLNSSGAIIQSATASSAGIKFISPMMSAGYGRMQVNHAIANPLCPIAGPISYSVVIEGYSDGSARIRGNIKKVPHHEAYMYPKSEANGKTIFRRASGGFHCLSTNCANESISESVG